MVHLEKKNTSSALCTALATSNSTKP